MESALGNFMVLNRWNIEMGEFSVQNVNIGIQSHIGGISRSNTNRNYKQGEIFELGLRLGISGEIYDSAPAVWESSDCNVVQVLDEETLVSNSVSSSSKYKQKYKIVSTNLLAKSQGSATITCTIGDKKWSGKIKVKGTVTKPGKVKNCQ